MQIEMKGIDKSFGQNQVLKDAGFVLAPGEVHALMGKRRRQVYVNEDSYRSVYQRWGNGNRRREGSAV